VGLLLVFLDLRGWLLPTVAGRSDGRLLMKVHETKKICFLNETIQSIKLLAIRPIFALFIKM
jgi:hypothetical protein